MTEEIKKPISGFLICYQNGPHLITTQITNHTAMTGAKKRSQR